ncbi:MAG: hypothetical protein DMF69_05730 [Acidobacteria bacterium]|nr:MAG: hypothetical protein DMF69_05730 [Acidobacteriota bacterium]
MLRKTGLQVVALSLTIIVSSAFVLAQKRISFRRGASSATLNGSIEGKGYTEYVINGRAGQVLSIQITSANGAVLVNAGSASGKNFNVEMTGGDHLLSIVNEGRGATNYTLKVAIR